MKGFLIAMALACLVLPVHAQRVLDVHDGDSITIENGKPKKMKVRIWGIDTPELKQAQGDEAGAILRKRLLDKDVQLECVAKHYRRDVCRVKHAGEDIGEWMVRSGWAWDEVHSKGRYRNAMFEAIQER